MNDGEIRGSPLLMETEASIERRVPPQLHFLPLLFGNQDLAWLGALERTDDAALFDLVDDARGAGIAELQTRCV